MEEGGQAGGRRNAPHEFPKRNEPYTEDMGRRVRRFILLAYTIGPDYDAARDALIAAMEEEGPGLLVHPSFGEELWQPDVYTTREFRERGGYCEIELVFVEPGSREGFSTAATASVVQSRADSTGTASSNALDKRLAAGGAIET